MLPYGREYQAERDKSGVASVNNFRKLAGCVGNGSEDVCKLRVDLCRDVVVMGCVVGGMKEVE